MATIEHVELCMVDLQPKVRRTDAIQSFVSQQTPLVRVTDSDGAVGVGYSYTIGQGGPAVMSLLADTLAPQLIGQDGENIDRLWRSLMFSTHATVVGAITSLALAAIDTVVLSQLGMALMYMEISVPVKYLLPQKTHQVIGRLQFWQT